MPLGSSSQHRDLRVGKRIMTRPMTWLIAAGLVAGAAGAASAQTHAHGHTGQAAHSRAGSDTTATREFKAAHARMMRNMAMPFTGDADVDFRMHMIRITKGRLTWPRWRCAMPRTLGHGKLPTPSLPRNSKKSTNLRPGWRATALVPLTCHRSKWGDDAVAHLISVTCKDVRYWHLADMGLCVAHVCF